MSSSEFSRFVIGIGFQFSCVFPIYIYLLNRSVPYSIRDFRQISVKEKSIYFFRRRFSGCYGNQLQYHTEFFHVLNCELCNQTHD